MHLTWRMLTQHAAKLVDGEWQPYRRKTVSFQPKEAQFSSILDVAMGKTTNGSAG